MHTNTGIVYKTMDPRMLRFRAAALSETWGSSECRTAWLPTWDPPI